MPIMSRRQQKFNDSVTNKILKQAELKNKYNNKTIDDLPLQDKHPGLDLALMYAQPGNIIAKAFAPSMAKGFVNGLRQGDLQQAVMSGLVPESKGIPVTKFESLIRDFPLTGKGNVELWKAAGVNTSTFPKSLSEDLRKLQKEREAFFKHTKSDSPVSIITNKNEIETYFPSKTLDRIGHVHIEDVGNDLGFRWIEKEKSGLGLDPYTAIGTNSAKIYADALGKRLISGRELLDPNKTVKHIDDYFNIEERFRFPGKYHEKDLREGIIRQWMQNNPGKMPSQKELDFLFSKANEGSITALEDGYLNVSSFPEYFDKTGHFRSDLPENFIDELSIYLSEGRPGFYERYIGPMKKPFNDGLYNIPTRTLFIHPYVYENPKASFKNLGLFSTYKQGGKITRFKNHLHK